MFTVEDYNSVDMSCECNMYHTINTDLRNSESFVIVDMVKIKKTSTGFEFEIVDGSRTGGFYLTYLNGDYISLT